MDPALEDKLNSIIGQWEADDPGSTDVDTPPEPEPAGAMQLPEMDLATAAPPPPAQPIRLPPPESLRPSLATVGAGADGGLPRGGRPASSVPTAQPTASPDSLDWKQLADRMAKANINADVSRSSEHYLENAANSGPYRSRTDFGGEERLAKQPLELAQARQSLEHGQLANESSRAAMGASAAEKDPSSLQSQKAREAIKSMFAGSTIKLPPSLDNWSAYDIKRFADTGQLAHLEQARAATANAAADDQRKLVAGQEKAAAEAQALENSRKAYAATLRKLGIDPTRASQKDIDRAIQIEAAHAAGARADNPKLPPGQLAEVADYGSAAKAADQLFSDFEAAGVGGMLSKVAGKVSDATGADLGAVSQYNDKANTAAQTIGLALEGGKLGEADLPRYKAMMPQPGDSIERARAKRDNLKRALADKAAGRSTEWLKAGYRVPESTPAAAPSPETPPIPQAGTVRVRRKKDGVVAPVTKDVADRLIAKGTYEPE